MDIIILIFALAAVASLIIVKLRQLRGKGCCNGCEGCNQRDCGRRKEKKK